MKNKQKFTFQEFRDIATNKELAWHENMRVGIFYDINFGEIRMFSAKAVERVGAENIVKLLNTKAL